MLATNERETKNSLNRYGKTFLVWKDFTKFQ